jgi:hypothetical protein
MGAEHGRTRQSVGSPANYSLDVDDEAVQKAGQDGDTHDLSGFLNSFIVYIQAIVRGRTHRLSGSPIYDFFMGINGRTRQSVGSPANYSLDVDDEAVQKAGQDGDTQLAIAATLHFTGVFPLYTLIDDFGPIMSVSILSGFLNNPTVCGFAREL